MRQPANTVPFFDYVQVRHGGDRRAAVGDLQRPASALR